MQRLIQYLYEYQNGRRVRNVGFVKAEDFGDFLAFWIYGKEFPASVSRRLEIFLFYQKEETCVGILVGEITEMRAMTAYPLRYDGNTDKIAGVILRGSEDGMDKWYAADWKDSGLTVEQMVEEWKLEKTISSQGIENEEMQAPEPENEIEKNAETVVYKITRKDLVQLPRQEWKLANNRFLMHGCRNYHHLISFEKDGECWLGVPGIYHIQEEKAARAFGFVEFMTPEDGELSLTEEEQSEQEEFGYWCRRVNNIIKG